VETDDRDPLRAARTSPVWSARRSGARTALPRPCPPDRGKASPLCVCRLQLSMAVLGASDRGHNYRGYFEKRPEGVITELTSSRVRLIVSLTEIHTHRTGALRRLLDATFAKLISPCLQTAESGSAGLGSAAYQEYRGISRKTIALSAALPARYDVVEPPPYRKRGRASFG